jgi:hypothetical protein
MASNKGKPIMTKGKYINYLSLNETEQFAILDGLSDNNKLRIDKWLKTVVVKIIDGEQYIENPLQYTSGLHLYINRDSSYPTLYKWCVANFDYIEKLPIPKPVDEIKLNEIFFYANEWKQNPKVDPYTKEQISISLSPDGKYVKLYIKIIDELVSNILKSKTKKELSVEECKKIRDSLPDEHARVILDDKDDKKDIYYDYLFIVYFVNSKIKYDPVFQKDLKIYLDLVVYKISDCVYNDDLLSRDFEETGFKDSRDVKYLYLRKFLRNYLLDMSKNDLSIHSLVMKLCIDIEKIQYMKDSKGEDEANFNMKVLEYYKAIFYNIPIHYFVNVKTSIHIHRKELTRIILLPELMKNEQVPTKYKGTYDTIKTHLKDPVTNIFETLLSIYNSILKLYKDSKKSDAYKKIKDPYKNKSSESPPIPIRPQLTRDLIMYKARLKNLNDPLIATTPKEREEQRVFFSIEYPLDKIKQNDKDLLDYDKKIIEYEKLLKEYEKKDIAKKSDTTSPIKSDNVIDPYSQEAFSDMSPKRLAYLSDIFYNDGKKVFHYRFDTVNMYNYILTCIDLCDKPINFFNRAELTDANLNEICKKIKHFTKTPTYNSSTEIRALLDDDCSKYNNRLVLDYDIIDEKTQQKKDIEGSINVYLNVKLGDLIFRVIQKKVLMLPYFNRGVLDRFPPTTHIYPQDILDILDNKLKEGKLIGSRFFPYRQKNNILMNLPQFPFEFNDDTKNTLEKLKRYKTHISVKYN